MFRTYKAKKGFTIIEIVIATTVLFIGIIGIFSVFPSTFKMANLSKITTRMTMVGQSLMEEMIALGFENISPGTYTDLDLSHLIDDATLRGRFQETQIEILDNVQGHWNGEARNPLNEHPILYQINVKVSYEMNPGKQKIENFVTYLSNPTY